MTAGFPEAPELLETSANLPNKHSLAVSPNAPREEAYVRNKQRATSPGLTIDPAKARDASYFSQTVTEPGTPVQYFLDDDVLSVVSTPNRDFIRMSNSHISSAYRLANSFFQRGELENAGVLFEKILLHTKLDAQSLERVEICMQIAAVKMYRGYYENSRKDLLDIESQLRAIKASGHSNESTTAEPLYNCQRWLASCRLLAGQWQDAVLEMRSLLDNDPERYHVRLHRDLSLAYAYLGQYDEARTSLKLALERAKFARRMDSVDRDVDSKAPLAGQDVIGRYRKESSTKQIPQNEKQRRLVMKQRKQLRTKERSVRVAKASIDMLAGDYPAALAASSEALDLIKTTVGVKHFKTLATATLKAWCLAYNGKYTEAETLCSTTYKATTRALGHRHPQTLEAMECLVYIFRCQGRFAEAIGTGMSLDTLSTQRMRDMGIYHPQPIRAKFQLAKSLLANGDYATSKLKFDEVVANAEAAMGKKHPETLKFKSEQARVSLYLGDVSEARNLAFRVAAQLFELCTQNQNSDLGIAELCEKLETGPRKERLSRVNKLLDLLIKQAPSQTTLHPSLVSTLQLVANIEVRKFQLTGHKGGRADLATARQILTTLQNYHSNPVVQSIVLASSVDLDLATLHKEENTKPTDLAEAVELSSRAYQSRKSLMGDNHLDTLCAQRDLTIARCLRGLSGSDPDEFPLAGVKRVCDSILKTLESRLGLLHPETLTSQLWCFTVDLLLQDDGSNLRKESWEDLIENLSDPQVVRERLVESLVMKRQLAGLLNGTGKSKEALVLIDGAILEMESAGAAHENEMLKETLSGLMETILELRKDCETMADNIDL
jgi:tetratricopeptide (TPR) repeat protein